jgi:hypothetical protein
VIFAIFEFFFTSIFHQIMGPQIPRSMGNTRTPAPNQLRTRTAQPAARVYPSILYKNSENIFGIFGPPGGQNWSIFGKNSNIFYITFSAFSTIFAAISTIFRTLQNSSGGSSGWSTPTTVDF